MLPVMLHLGDGFVDVSQRLVLAVLLYALRHVRLPAFGEFLEGADIQIAVMEIVLEFRHRARHETPVLADGIAAHGRCARRDVFLEKSQHLLFHCGLVQRGSLDPLDESRLAVGGFIPRVHAVHDAVGLMHHQHGGFGNGFQIIVGDDDGDLDDAVGIGIEPRHFHVYPDEVIFILCHNSRASL